MSRLQPRGDGHIELVDGERRIWSSDGRPVNLLSKANWLTIPVSIAFPDFTKRNAYAFTITRTQIGDRTSCMSFITIVPEERTLPEIVLGAVPHGTNYLDVRATLSRTNSPTAYLGFAVPNEVPTQQTHLPGGSCLCEETAIWARKFDVVQVGTSIVLRRKQSVFGGSNGIDWNPNNSTTFNNGGKRQGFTYGGGGSAQNAHIASVRDARGPSGNVDKNRGEDNACTISDNTDFSSTWAGTLLVRPGYIAPQGQQ